MPTALGAHNRRLAYPRSLLTKKGRRESGRFAFEGATLLAEAASNGVRIEEIYATTEAYEKTPLIRDLESSAVPVFLIDAQSMRKISDVETPSGIVGIAPIGVHDTATLLAQPGLVLLLADVNDPGNAGTLLRSASAFGVDRAIVGSLGADPFSPKVVRAAMGALFSLRVAVASPGEVRRSLARWNVVGLEARGERLGDFEWGERTVLAVGSERRGLGAWRDLCARFCAIPMRPGAESLNANVAGSIALYEATKRL